MSPATLAYAILVPALWGLQHVVIKIGLQAFPPFSLLQTVFAVAAEAIFLHERMTWLLVTGTLVCVGGVALTQGSPRRASRLPVAALPIPSKEIL